MYRNFEERKARCDRLSKSASVMVLFGILISGVSFLLPTPPIWEKETAEVTRLLISNETVPHLVCTKNPCHEHMPPCEATVTCCDDGHLCNVVLAPVFTVNVTFFTWVYPSTEFNTSYVCEDVQCVQDVVNEFPRIFKVYVKYDRSDFRLRLPKDYVNQRDPMWTVYAIVLSIGIGFTFFGCMFLYFWIQDNVVC